MEYKFRYTFRNSETKAVRYEYFTLEEIEAGQLYETISEMADEWELVGRDLWSGIESVFANDKVDIKTTNYEFKNYVVAYNEKYSRFVAREIHGGEIAEEIPICFDWKIKVIGTTYESEV